MKSSSATRDVIVHSFDIFLRVTVRFNHLILPKQPPKQHITTDYIAAFYNPQWSWLPPQSHRPRRLSQSAATVRPIRANVRWTRPPQLRQLRNRNASRRRFCSTTTHCRPTWVAKFRSVSRCPASSSSTKRKQPLHRRQLWHLTTREPAAASAPAAAAAFATRPAVRRRQQQRR